MLTIEVLPEPELPNRPVTLPLLSNATLISKSPSRFSMSTASILNHRGSAGRRGVRTTPKR